MLNLKFPSPVSICFFGICKLLKILITSKIVGSKSEHLNVTVKIFKVTGCINKKSEIMFQKHPQLTFPFVVIFISLFWQLPFTLVNGVRNLHWFGAYGMM
jgi:hypothetical protein